MSLIAEQSDFRRHFKNSMDSKGVSEIYAYSIHM